MAQLNYHEVGLAKIETDSYSQAEVFAGDTPAPVSDYGKVTGTVLAATIPAFTPVNVDPDTRAVTIARLAGSDPVEEPAIKANAITATTVVAGSAVGSSIPVFKAGTFNMNALNWDESFTTPAQKAAAFDMSECQIYVREPFYG